MPKLPPHCNNIFAAQPNVRFGWNNHDNPPENFQFVIDESNVGDIFEIRSKEGNKTLDSLDDVQQHLNKRFRNKVAFRPEVIQMLLTKMFGANFDLTRESLDTAGLVTVDIADSLGISEKQLLKLFKSLTRELIAVIKEQSDLITIKKLPKGFESRNGITTSRGVNLNDKTNPFIKDSEDKEWPSSLHWDIETNTKKLIAFGPFLSFIHGQRENLDDTSALSLYCDFAQWFQEKTDAGELTTPLEEMNYLDLRKLLIKYSAELKENYAIELPANTDSTRFTLFLQDPKLRGLLHGVTEPTLLDDDKKAKRKLWISWIK